MKGVINMNLDYKRSCYKKSTYNCGNNYMCLIVNHSNMLFELLCTIYYSMFEPCFQLVLRKTHICYVNDKNINWRAQYEKE